ncbi:hypothetical protein [Streptomyces sp. NPDC091027]|uniref:hypothetical protein n=1 Tax=Streptomyces sp. NPDC091027 TaxID=3365971 RepID=UPI00382C221C
MGAADQSDRQIRSSAHQRDTLAVTLTGGNRHDRWLVDDHHGTASMTVYATTQAVTRRFTKPFGESCGSNPFSWVGVSFPDLPSMGGAGMADIQTRRE